MLRALARIEDALLWLTYAALALMMTLITVDALGRYVLRMTLPDVYHLTEMYLMPLVVFMAISATQRMRGHVNVTLVTGFLPARINAGIRALVFLASAVVFAAVAKGSWDNAWSHLINWRVTGGVVPWPTGVSRVIVPIGTGLLALRLVVDAIMEGTFALGLRQNMPSETDKSGTAL